MNSCLKVVFVVTSWFWTSVMSDRTSGPLKRALPGPAKAGHYVRGARGDPPGGVMSFAADDVLNHDGHEFMFDGRARRDVVVLIGVMSTFQ